MATRKRTHKFRALSDIQGVVDIAPTTADAAKQLGISTVTLWRWVKAGKVKPKGAREGVPLLPATENQTPEAWAASVREGATFDATQGALVDCATDALRISRDASASAGIRLQAMGRYAALVKQLNLGLSAPAEQAAPSRAVTQRVARATGDPRAFLMALTKNEASI